jgi:tetratricopeptide (TPR) repeat protein
MPSMASSIHPDFRDDVTAAEAHAVDQETQRLLHEQMAADNASGRQRYIQLAKEMLQIRLRAYKPESPPVAGAWCLIGSAHLKASQLHEAKDATEKSLEIYAAGDDAEKENSAALAREQLALIFEGLGQLPNAKKARLQGASDGTMVCSSSRVC